MSELTGTGEEIRVIDNPEMNQFEAHVGGHVAFVSYVKRGDTIFLIHTEVPKELQGRGLASLLAHEVLERARAERWRVVARCPYIVRYIERHPEYQSLLRRES